MSKIDENYNLKSFKPPIWLSSSLIQTSLASFKYRKRGNNKMMKAAKTIILNCEDNVRLKGSYSRSEQNKSLVIFLHGWEGYKTVVMLFHVEITCLIEAHLFFV